YENKFLDGNREAFGINVIPQNYMEMLHQANFDHLPFSLMQKFELFMIDLLPTAVELLILYFLIRLFKLYEQGEIFSICNVRYIRNIGYLLLIGQVINMFYEALLGFVLSWQHGSGHGSFGITLNNESINTILIGFMVILISWIMAEGCKLRDEQQLTI
ncbi:MAG TPA: DUF2975 domain-containing protein, partial [Coxiellaceae bacterium]|nr:DUF2975 domain-containing protein [Coxiellaceae bacterium]